MIIITGAAGFIGSALAWKLNESGRKDLLLVDHLATNEKWKNLVPLDYQDYLEKDDLLALLENDPENKNGIEVIFHLGACSSTTETDASFLVKNNFSYTKTLANWCVQNSVPFIYASSAATYGDGKMGYSDTADLKTLSPLNMYGYSKQMFDTWAECNGKSKYIVGLKYFNVYGPNEYHKEDMRSVVIKAYHQIMEKGEVNLFKSYHEDYKDGEQLRDFIYIKDAVSMTLECFEKKIPGGLYNIGTGQARSWIDLINALFAALGKKPKIKFIPMPENLRPKYQYYTQAEMEKFNTAGLGGTQYSLEEGIKDYAKYLGEPYRFLGQS